MKYPASYYPNSGIQHTRAVIALTTASICLEMYKADPKSPMAALLDKIQSAIKSCSRETKKKKLSAGATRAMNNCSHILAPYIEREGIRLTELYWHWGAIVWCALTFIEDVLATCPQYVDGHKRKWQNLHDLVADLADILVEKEQGKHKTPLDEEGTFIYEKAAWALDGVAFKLDNAGAA